jgi:hypothetical protein
MSKGKRKMKLVPTMEIVTLGEILRDEKHTMIYGEMIKSYLEELHPQLPAYFCNSGYYVWPLCVDGDIDEFLRRNRAKRIDPDGHVDKDVLIAIHNIINDDKYAKVRIDYIPYLAEVLAEELRNAHSELSAALTKAYGKKSD